MENAPNNTGDHWITITSAIAVVIIALIQPLMQVLFSTWLTKRQSNLSAANPDMNQPDGWKRKILVLLNRIPSTIPPLIAIAIGIASLIFFIRPDWIATQMISLFISIYVGLIAWNAALYNLNKATKRIDSRIDAIVDVLKTMVKFSSQDGKEQIEDRKTLSELQFDLSKELHARLKELEARLQTLENLQEQEREKSNRKKPRLLD